MRRWRDWVSRVFTEHSVRVGPVIGPAGICGCTSYQEKAAAWISMSPSKMPDQTPGRTMAALKRAPASEGENARPRKATAINFGTRSANILHLCLKGVATSADAVDVVPSPDDRGTRQFERLTAFVGAKIIAMATLQQL